MAVKDLHEKPFDEATLAKLDIFEKYALAWLPTFVMQSTPTLCIFDLFAGTGYDKNSIAGSPIRLLEVIKQYIGLVFKNNVKIKLYLNEYKTTKRRMLEASVEQFLADNKDVARAITYEIYGEDFNIVFNRLLPEIEKYPSLVLLDQNGIKFTNIRNLLALEKTHQTDFLFFMSSSYVRRFGDTKEFSNYLNIDIEALKNNPYRFIHQDVVKAISNQLPLNSKLRLFPFSIKKGTNIHGLVFGAKHPRAVEKFLNVVWDRYPINGEANFDINEESAKASFQYSLFDNAEPKRTKIEKFQELLEQTLQQHTSVTNKFIYSFTLEQGHPLKHAHNYIRSLKKSGKVWYSSRSPKLNYKDAYKENDVVNIEWIGK